MQCKKKNNKDEIKSIMFVDVCRAQVRVSIRKGKKTFSKN